MKKILYEILEHKNFRIYDILHLNHSMTWCKWKHVYTVIILEMKDVNHTYITATIIIVVTIVMVNMVVLHLVYPWPDF